MKRTKPWQLAMVGLAGFGLTLPAPLVQAAGPQADGKARTTATAAAITDIELREGDVLFGQVVGLSGQPVADTRVALRSAARELAQATTDRSGYFAFSGLEGGVYELVTEKAQGTYRVWRPNTAPPVAQPGALLVVGGQQVAGQSGPIAYWLKNPLVIMALIGAAATIPIAIHNNRMHRSASD